MAAQQLASGVAGRYANALFDLATEQKSVAATAKALAGLSTAISGSTDLQHLLNSPVMKSAEQMSALAALARKGGLDGIALNFVNLLGKNRRLSILPAAIAGFQALVAEQKGEVGAEVTSAEKLSAAQIKDLTAALKTRVGKDVALTTLVDPTLLGGLSVKIGSTLIDNSLKTKLENLKVTMKESA